MTSSRKGMPLRRRKLFPFFIFVQLTHGRHSSVTWLDQYTCVVNGTIFAKTLGTTVTWMTNYLSWLKKHRYLTEFSGGDGCSTYHIKIRPPVNREEAT